MTIKRTLKVAKLVGRAGKKALSYVQKTSSHEIVLRSELNKKNQEIASLKEAWPGLLQPQAFEFDSPRPKGDLTDEGGGEMQMDVMRFNTGGVEVALGGKPEEYEKELPSGGKRGRRKLAPPAHSSEKIRMTDEAFMHRLVAMYVRGWLACSIEAGKPTQPGEEERVITAAEDQARALFQKIMTGQG